MSLEARLKGFLNTTKHVFLRSALGLSLTVMPTLYNCGSEGGDGPQNYGCQSDSECKGGRVCVNGECVYPEEKPEEDVFIGKDPHIPKESQPTCYDHCSPSGKKQCFGSGWKECGNYGSNNCLEWGPLNECGSDKYCEEGQCKSSGEDAYVPPQKDVLTCTDECSPSGKKQCFGNGYKTCGEHDYDDCLEWSPLNKCKDNEKCENGECKTIELKYSCAEIFQCLGECDDGNACYDSCLSQGSEDALKKYKELGICYSGYCGNLSTPSLSADLCFLENCKKEIENCLGLFTGTMSCSELLTCLSNCDSSDGGCLNDCYNDSTYNAQINFLKIGVCLEQNNCLDLPEEEIGQCAQENCLSEINTCQNN